MKRVTWFASLLLGSAVTCGAASAQDAELFSKLDKNGDGKVTADEVNEDQKRFFERLVRVGDKNSDGALTKEELTEAAKPDNREVANPGRDGGGRDGGGFEEIFKRADANGDGKLTKDELPERMRERIAPLFERLGKTELTLDDLRRGAAGLGGGGPLPDEMFKRLDANNDGKVTLDEVPAEFKDRVRPIFERLGKDAITRDDLARLRPEGRPEGRPGDRPNPEQMFRQFDANGDGKLTLAEVPDRSRPIVERLLRESGKDLEGSLTKEEALAAIEKLGPPPGREGRPPEGPEGRRPPPRLPRIFEMLDADRDGRLSQDELVKAGELFKQLDENADGQLDPRELLGPPPGPPEFRPEGGRGDGDRPPPRERDGERRPEGRRPEGERGEGDRPRRPEGDRPPGERRRPEGEREGPRREGDRPAGERREGDRRDGERREGDRKEEGRGEGRRDGERRPEGGRDRESAGLGGRAFSRFDVNNDGVVSPDEVPAQFKDAFQKLDVNGDGAIDAGEIQNLRLEAVEPRRGR